MDTYYFKFVHLWSNTGSYLESLPGLLPGYGHVTMSLNSPRGGLPCPDNCNLQLCLRVSPIGFTVFAVCWFKFDFYALCQEKHYYFLL